MIRTITSSLLVCATLWTGFSRAEPLAQTTPQHRYVYTWLLTDSEAQSVRIGARALLNDGAVTPEYADIAAKILVERGATAISTLDIDTARWLIRVLAASHSQRYAQVLKSLANRPGRVGPEATTALTALTDAAETAFNAEDIDLPSIRSRLVATRDASKRVGTADFAATPVGVCLSDATERLGYPDAVVVVERPRGITHGAVVELQDVMFEYADVGVVEFARGANDWCAVTVSRWEQSFGPMGDAMRSYFVRGFLSDNAPFLRAATRRGYQVKLSDEKQLDIAAFRLRRDMKTGDPALQDALEWVSHLLRLSRNPRYLELMQVLQSEGATKDLRKHGLEGTRELSPD